MAKPALKLHEAIDAYEIALMWIEEHEQEIEDAGGVLPPALLELLEEAEGALEHKLGRVALMTISLKRQAEAQREEARRITAHARTTERQRETLKDGYLRWCLTRLGVQRVDTPLAKVRRQPAPIKVQLLPGAPIPEKYQIIHPAPEPTFDAVWALEEVKQTHAAEIGELVPGAPPVLIGGLLVSRGESVIVW